MKTRVLLFVIGIVLALGSSASAALVWENPEADLHPSLSDKTAVAHFKYKNTGAKPIKITQVQSSCGCTTAAPPKDPIAPGGNGEIIATFHIGDRSGEQTKTIRVRTDEPNAEETVLKLKATIPRLLEYTPALLYWRRDEERATKTIAVKIGDFPVTKLDVTSTDPSIKIESVAVPNEKAFRIAITPDVGSRPVNAAIKIQPDFPKDAPKTFYANVRVDVPGMVNGPVGVGPGAVARSGPGTRPRVAFGSGAPGAIPSVTPSPAPGQTPPK